MQETLLAGNRRQERLLTTHSSTVKVARDVSVVMVSYYTGPVLWRSIDSVLSQNRLKKLVIVNNGNPDKVLEKLKSIAANEPRLEILTGHGNIGFSRACNLGAKAVKSNYLLLLNPDCLLAPSSLNKAVIAMKEHKDAWVAGCKIINPDTSEQGGSRRNLLTPLVALVETFNLHRIFPKSLPRIHIHQTIPPKSAMYVPAISGAFMLLKRTRYDRIGGMDEGYFFHVEDLDFCLQVKELGGKVLYLPEVEVMHYRSSSQVSTRFIEWNKAKGFSHYFRKNFRDAYFPGFLVVMYMAIYTRFAVRLILSFFIRYNPIAALKDVNHAESNPSARGAFLRSFHSLEGTISDDILSAIQKSAPFIIVGSSGQVGLAILRRLLLGNARIFAFYNKTVVDFDYPNITWHQSDIVKSELNLYGIDHASTLIYTAAIWELPKHLRRFSELGVKRVICFSSTSVFGKADSENPYEETLVSNFKQAELEVAKYCENLGIAWTIIRPTLIYGIGMDKNVSSIMRFIKRFHFFPIVGEGNGLRQPVHVDDLATAVISSLNNKATYGKCYNLAGGEKLSYREMVRRIFNLLGKRVTILPLSILPHLLNIYSTITNNPELNGAVASRMNKNLVFDEPNALNDFGYNPRSFLHGGMDDLLPK